MDSPDGPVVLFDGVCSVCDASVQFIIAHDPEAVFRFASLQSPVGRALAAARGIDARDLDTVVLITPEETLTRSDAVTEIARRLGAPWSALSSARLLPRPLRDAAYRLFARNRTRLFGQRDACRIPTPGTRARFLDL